MVTPYLGNYKFKYIEDMAAVAASGAGAAAGSGAAGTAGSGGGNWMDMFQKFGGQMGGGNSGGSDSKGSKGNWMRAVTEANKDSWSKYIDTAAQQQQAVLPTQMQPVPETQIQQPQQPNTNQATDPVYLDYLKAATAAAEEKKKTNTAPTGDSTIL